MKIKLQFYIILKNTITVILYGVKLTNLDQLVQIQKTLITKIMKYNYHINTLKIYNFLNLKKEIL